MTRFDMSAMLGFLYDHDIDPEHVDSIHYSGDTGIQVRRLTITMDDGMTHKFEAYVTLDHLIDWRRINRPEPWGPDHPDYDEMGQ